MLVVLACTRLRGIPMMLLAKRQKGKEQLSSTCPGLDSKLYQKIAEEKKQRAAPIAKV